LLIFWKICKFSYLTKLKKTPAYYTIFGLWKLNEVPFETYIGVGNVLDEHERKIERYKAHPPLMLNVLLSIDLTVPCYCQGLGNHFTTSGRFSLMASPSSFSIFEVGDL
jgi:hypothetical protein